MTWTLDIRQKPREGLWGAHQGPASQRKDSEQIRGVRAVLVAGARSSRARTLTLSTDQTTAGLSFSNINWTVPAAQGRWVGAAYTGATQGSAQAGSRRCSENGEVRAVNP